MLYFFPAAFTGGCNAEARAFAEQVADFQKAGATVSACRPTASTTSQILLERMRGQVRGGQRRAGGDRGL